MFAAQEGQLAIVKWLVEEKKADVMLKDSLVRMIVNYMYWIVALLLCSKSYQWRHRTVPAYCDNKDIDSIFLSC